MYASISIHTYLTLGKDKGASLSRSNGLKDLTYFCFPSFVLFALHCRVVWSHCRLLSICIQWQICVLGKVESWTLRCLSENFEFFHSIISCSYHNLWYPEQVSKRASPIIILLRKHPSTNTATPSSRSLWKRARRCWIFLLFGMQVDVQVSGAPHKGTSVNQRQRHMTDRMVKMTRDFENRAALVLRNGQGPMIISQY